LFVKAIFVQFYNVVFNNLLSERIALKNVKLLHRAINLIIKVLILTFFWCCKYTIFLWTTNIVSCFLCGKC